VQRVNRIGFHPTWRIPTDAHIIVQQMASYKETLWTKRLSTLVISKETDDFRYGGTPKLKKYARPSLMKRGKQGMLQTPIAGCVRKRGRAGPTENASAPLEPPACIVKYRAAQIILAWSVRVMDAVFEMI
jgi:hypothetical protein